MVMAAVGYLQKNTHPSEESVRHALEGNLCRCTGYTNIVRSILAAVPATNGHTNGHAPADVEVPGG
jgi:carbon-monoxide dehydrogenase small subunit